MPRLSRRVATASCLGFALVAAGISAPTGAHAGIVLADRYASPTGTPADTCAKTDPCDITTAINGAAATSTVFIGAGEYGRTATPLTAVLDTEATVLGEDPQHPPIIVTSATTGLEIDGGVVSNLSIASDGSDEGLLLRDAIADHVAVYDDGGTFGACALYGSSLGDSICSESAASHAAIGIVTDSGVEQDNVVRGVTAVAHATSGVGLNIEASDTTVNLTVTNSILRGRTDDLVLSGDTDPVAVTVDHSTYNAGRATTTGTATVVPGVGNVSKAPTFVDVGAADLRETATSPTVDAGAKDPKADVDLAGNPRTLGKTPDIGAYEFLEKPKIGHLKRFSGGGTTARLSVKINGEGLPTRAKATATSKHGKLNSRVIALGTGKKKVNLTIKHLDRHGTYRIAVSATNKAGKTRSRRVLLLKNGSIPPTHPTT